MDAIVNKESVFCAKESGFRLYFSKNGVHFLSVFKKNLSGVQSGWPDDGWCSQHDWGAANTMHGAADMMAQWVRPPYMEKNKLPLNQYLGIFMHFESIFF